jgi:hypothetical protein
MKTGMLSLSYVMLCLVQLIINYKPSLSLPLALLWVVAQANYLQDFFLV